MTISAVIFDMDGVLCDSEPFICEAAMRMFEQTYGVIVRREDFAPFVGAGEDRFIGGVAEKYDVPLVMPRDKEQTYKIYLEIIQGNLHALPGAIDFLAACRRRGLNTALATSADSVKMRGNLHEIKIKPTDFDAIVTGDDVQRKKPDPQIFLLAASRLSVAPQNSLVIEDAPNGIRAAKSAGAQCLGITSSFDAETLRQCGADHIARDLANVPPDLFGDNLTRANDAGAVAESNAGKTEAKHRLPSLRVVVTLIVVAPIAVAAAALFSISAVTSHNIAELLGQELINDATARVTGEVTNYIKQAVQLSDLYTRRLQTGKLSPTNLAAWEQIMFDDLATTPDVASICFGNPAGDAVYFQRAHGRLEFGIAEGAHDCAAIEWYVFPDGAVDRSKPLRTYIYDPRKRPWYAVAIKNATPVWTPAYFWFGDAGGAMETGTGYTRVVDINKKMAGVLTVDVTLGAVSDFLRHQPFASKGAIFIIDQQGLLIAASEGPVTTADGKRTTLRASTSPAARAVASAAPQSTTSLATASTMPSGGLGARPVYVEGMGDARANVTSFAPYPGTRWRVITVLPESAFLSQAHAMRRRAILLAITAVIGSMIIGLLFSRRLSQPIMKLCDHVVRIGAGDFAARLKLTGARELRQLADATNRMAAGLRQRMELEKSMELATHVQQSLLPNTTPRVRGLQVFGHSKYCESTGGDYLDYIDVADLPNDRAFIAVGDVMGHGVGSALLMATARAAVRTSATVGNESLAPIMARVNHVLACDARHGLFMTMLLLIIEPHDGIVRWCNAGHEPATVYDPATQTFLDLEGSDLLLGVEEEVRYHDHQRIGFTAGQILFVGTDGTWEARSASNEEFGKQRIREVIRTHADRSAEEISAALQKSLDDFVGRSKLHDDVTFVIAKFTPIGDAPAAQSFVSIASSI